MNVDDAIYIERWVRDRDADAFHELVVRYAGMVFAASKRVLGNASDAEDAAQECFQVLASAPEPPAAYLGPWLHRVATNIALNKRRAESRLRLRESRFADAQPTIVEPTWNDIYTFVDEALAELPEHLRSPLVAHFLEGRSQSDIAAGLGIPRQTLNHRIQKGVDEIRRSLGHRGIPIGGAALGAMFAVNLAEASVAPPSLVAALGKVALSGAGTSPVAVQSSWIPATLGMKSIAAAAVAVIIVGAGYVAFRGGSGSAPAGTAQYVEPGQPAARRDGAGAAQSAPLARPSEAPAAVNDEPVAQLAAAAPVVPGLPALAKTANEAIEAYVAHQKKIERITITFELSKRWSMHYPPESQQSSFNGSGMTYQTGELSSDGTRLYLYTRNWGDDAYGSKPLSNANERINIYDGKQDIQWDSGGVEFPLGAGTVGNGAPIGTTIRESRSWGRYFGFWSMHFGPQAFGFFTDEGRRIDQLLRETADKSMRIVREGETDYCVVDAETDYGSFSVWFDPNLGYNIARVIAVQREGQLNWKGVERGLPKSFVRNITYTVNEFVQVNGLWVPESFTLESNEVNTDKGYHAENFTTYTRTSIVLDPDFAASGTFAFMRGVPEGSIWRFRTFPGDRHTEEDDYLWWGGQLVPKPIEKNNRG